MLKKAVKVLKNGGVVAYPTDTAYGLGADPENKRAVLKIFKIKGRKKEKSLPLIAGNFKIAKKYAIFNKVSLRLARKYWPGPLTLVLEPTKLAKKSLSKYVFAGGKIAIRVPSNNLARRLSLAIKKPITSTSANVSGEPMCWSKNQIAEQFKGRKYQPDDVVDAGRLKKAKPSTIAEARGDEVVILRQGKIKV